MQQQGWLPVYSSVQPVQCGVAAGTALKLHKSSNVLLQQVSREERRTGVPEDRGERSL